MPVRLLETSDEYDAVYQLVHDEYVKSGYIEPREDGRFVHYQGILDKIPQTDVFLAYDDAHVLIGTNSITRDSENGLHTNIDFPLQTMRERMTGKNLMTSWRIAVKNDARDGAKTWTALVKATVWRAIDLGCETMLFTFNPKHWVIYHKVLNMELIGFNDNALGLEHAPEVLMRLYRRDVPDKWLMREL